MKKIKRIFRQQKKKPQSDKGEKADAKNPKGSSKNAKAIKASEALAKEVAATFPLDIDPHSTVVPPLVKLISQYLRKNCLDIVGLFRVSAPVPAVKHVLQEFKMGRIGTLEYLAGTLERYVNHFMIPLSCMINHLSFVHLIDVPLVFSLSCCVRSTLFIYDM